MHKIICEYFAGIKVGRIGIIFPSSTAHADQQKKPETRGNNKI
jgi:hypothetical protein